VIDGDIYACGRTVLYRDHHARREDGCPGGLFICGEGVEVSGGFMESAYDARAVRKEHEEAP
jgi:hypothetical protein